MTGRDDAGFDDGSVAKPWWLSRAIVGAIIVFLAQIARLAGLEIDSAALTDVVLDAVTILGAALAWWGRVKATRPISRRVAPGVGSDRPLSAGKHPVSMPVDGGVRDDDVQLGADAAPASAKRAPGAGADPRGVWGGDY